MQTIEQAGAGAPSSPSSPTPADDRSPRATAWIAAAVLVGLALRVWEAWESSLWLDETHSIYHASRESFGAVIESVGRDFHVPFFYLFLHLFGGFEHGAWLRAIPIASSLLTLIPLIALARESRGGERAAVACAWLYALLPYQVHYGAELRPYAWLELFSAVAAWAAFSERGDKVVRIGVFIGAVGLGMLTHVIMAMAVVAIGAARLFVRGGNRIGLPALIASGAAGVAPAVPWLLWFANWSSEKREAHVEEVGERDMRPALLRELRDLPTRLIEPYIGSLGEPWSWLAAAGLALFVLTVLAVVVLAWRSRRSGDRARPAESGRIALAASLYALAQFALITAFSLRSWDRVPLQYYVAVSWTIPLLVAVAWAMIGATRARAALGAAALASTLAMGVAVAGGQSREDFRGAVALARQWGEELTLRDPAHPPIYTAVLAQPSGVFPHVLPYLAYAPGLGCSDPEVVPRPGVRVFDRPLICIRRALPLHHERWIPLLTGRTIVREQQVHERLWVYELAPLPPEQR